MKTHLEQTIILRIMYKLNGEKIYENKHILCIITEYLQIKIFTL